MFIKKSASLIFVVIPLQVFASCVSRGWLSGSPTAQYAPTSTLQRTEHAHDVYTDECTSTQWAGM